MSAAGCFFCGRALPEGQAVCVTCLAFQGASRAGINTAQSGADVSMLASVGMPGTDLGEQMAAGLRLAGIPAEYVNKPTSKEGHKNGK